MEVNSLVTSAITNSTTVFHPLPTHICQSKEVKLIPQGYPCCNCTGTIPQELGGQGQKSIREACDWHPHLQGASWFPGCHGIVIMFQWLYPIPEIGKVTGQRDCRCGLVECKHMDMYVCMCMQGGRCICMGMWKPENNLRYSFSGARNHLVVVVFETGSLTGLESPSRLSWLASDPQKSTCFCLNPSIRGMCHHAT